jgi:hypothetical protein
VYGSNPDANVLERAVTWVIILIVAVFDPLAVVMLLASQMTFDWLRRERETPELDTAQTVLYSETFPTLDDAVDTEMAKNFAHTTDVEPAVELTPFEVEPHAVLDTPVDTVKAPEPDPKIVELQKQISLVEQDRDDLIDFVKQNQDDYDKISDLHFRSMQREQALTEEIAQLNEQLNQAREELVQRARPVNIVPNETVHITVTDQAPVITSVDQPKVETVSEPVPELIGEDIAVLDRPGDYITPPAPKLPSRKPNAGFGVDFPNDPVRGDMFLRTDFKPSRLFKWNDTKWIEVNKASTDAYTYNDTYIQYLAEKLFSGEYNIDDLSEVEQQQIQTVIGNKRA